MMISTTKTGKTASNPIMSFLRGTHEEPASGTQSYSSKTVVSESVKRSAEYLSFDAETASAPRVSAFGRAWNAVKSIWQRAPKEEEYAIGINYYTKKGEFVESVPIRRDAEVKLVKHGNGFATLMRVERSPTLLSKMAKAFEAIASTWTLKMGPAES